MPSQRNPAGRPLSRRHAADTNDRREILGKKTLAEKADKFDCYQRSVQTPDHEVEFFDRVYRDCFGESPLHLREDFAGTFAVCCRWAKSDPRRTALAVDLCEETLAWGRENNLTKLNEDQRSRVRVLVQDVRKRNRPPADVLAAQNFSFWILKTRREVVEYFRIARSNLKSHGVMVMDMMGGYECQEDGTVDRRKIGKGKRKFRYEWEQARFDPITHDATFRIHFEFKDGSRIETAFEYEWRFWSMPEVREMLIEAGFDATHVYWENEDAEGDGDGTYDRAEHGTADPSWICYLVAVKGGE